MSRSFRGIFKLYAVDFGFGVMGRIQVKGSLSLKDCHESGYILGPQSSVSTFQETQSIQIGPCRAKIAAYFCLEEVFLL